MFADLDTGNSRVDGIVVGARLLGLGIPFLLGVEGIHLGGPTPEPKENAVFCPALEVKIRGSR